MGYRLYEIENLTGASRRALLDWERLEVLAPERSSGLGPTYTDADLMVVRRLMRMLADGESESDAIGRIRGEQRTRPAADFGAVSVRSDIRDALLAYDRVGAEALTRQLGRYTYEQVVRDVYRPLVDESLELRARDDIDVAQQQHLSEFCRGKLIEMLHALPTQGSAGPRALAAGCVGEPCELDLLMMSLAFRLSGWQLTYLGPDVPLDGVGHAANHVGAHVVCQTMARASAPGRVMADARRLARVLPPGCVLAVHGSTGVCEQDDPDDVWFCEDFASFHARWASRSQVGVRLSM